MKVLKFFEKILPLVFWLLLIYAFDTPLFGTMTLISAVIHEIGHIIPAISLQGATLPRPTASGFLIKLTRVVSYRRDTFVTLGGPLINFAAFFLLLLLHLFTGFNRYFLFFALINLLTAISNLIPIRGYDGYRILENILLMHSDSYEASEHILSRVSFVFTVVLLFISLYLLLKIGEGYWIFGLLFVSFIKDIKKGL